MNSPSISKTRSRLGWRPRNARWKGKGRSTRPTSRRKRPARPPAMTLFRKSNVQALKEGWVQVWADDDFCVIDDERVVGCIRAEVILGHPKWRWAINGVPHGLPPPHNGIAATLNGAKAAFKDRYEA